MAEVGAGQLPSAIRNRRRWWGLGVFGLAQLIIVLDVTIIGVALPTLQDALHISVADRQWVVTAYTLTVAGLLLLGGRIADYIGRKRAFLIALVGFAAASAMGGTAVNLGMLVAARAAQGCSAALLAPALLSLLSTTFATTRERSIAFAVFGAVSGGGAAIGLMLGGVLTEFLGWRSVFYVTVPLALIAAGGAVFAVSESHVRESARFDILGAVLATAGPAALVYGFREAADKGWTASETLGLLASGVALLVVFVLTALRKQHPLLPLRIVAHRGRGGAYLANIALGIGMYGATFFLTFYMQAVNTYTPMQTGIAFLPQVGGVMIATVLISRLAIQVPPRLLISVGLMIAAGGLGWLSQLHVNSPYSLYVLPALLAVGIGMGAVSPTAANLATINVAPRESGVASATVNASQMLGGSLGIALLNTIAANQTALYLAAHEPGGNTRLSGLVDGYTLAAAVGGGILAAAAIVIFCLINIRMNVQGDAQ